MEKKIEIIFDKFFEYKGNKFFAEGVDIGKLAEKYKTPLYIYSLNYLTKKINDFKGAFSSFPSLICYSVKANSNLSILKSIKTNGLGVDVVSEGELRRAIIAGFGGDKIVFAGVGKTEEEIEFAIKNKIYCFNVENEKEIEFIEKYGKKYKRNVLYNIRLNLDLDIETHHYLKTSKNETKFGLDFETGKKIIKKQKENKYSKLIGFHFHLGSQIKSSSFYIKALEKISQFIKETKFYPEVIDIGGGFGIPYSPEDKVEPIKNFGEKICEYVQNMKVKKIIVEPGRFIVGNTGILLTKVLYVKKRGQKTFVIVDAGMNDLIRPSLYNSSHIIVPYTKKQGKEVKVDVVGPICESGDFLGKDILLPESISAGDYIIIGSCGAYGFSMSSNYNSRRRPAEIIVDGEKEILIREREKFPDLWHNELCL
ncbi:MAG TPA: diaminopimelate decarboxylase [bacterium]|nr:diaminopimelate decarboxylase [bacterium]